jgi:Leucine-rich repeat (LRR) protein
VVTKSLIFALLILPFSILAQKTFIPDDAFEQALINLDLDNIFDDSVYTSAIDTVVMLYISNEGIVDLTGIEDFIALTDLFCHDNQIQTLDLSNNSNLFEVNCNSNKLTSLSLKNGNPNGLWYAMAYNNPDLFCVEVDNVAYANYNWSIDNSAVFSTNCNPTAISNVSVDRRLINIVDLFGMKVMKRVNQPVFYIYDDGSVEKRLFIE